MRIPYESNGAVGREFITLAPEIIAAILLTLQSGWVVAGVTAADSAAGEVEITERLRDGMRSTLNAGRLPWSKSFLIAPGTESRYLREMYDRYGERHFLAAYNAGPGRVDAWLRGRATLPGETRAYTATLLPRLGFGVPTAYGTTPDAVQDLTSGAAMSAFLSSPFRSSNRRPADAASSPVLAGGSTRAPT